MHRKYYTYSIVVFVIVSIGIFFFAKYNQHKIAYDNSSMIFFYGDTCPHCKNVEKYFQDNEMHSKVNFAEKEVYKNPANAKLLADKAKICGIKEDEVGVPFLWADEKCYIGDEEIIKFFNEKINEK